MEHTTQRNREKAAGKSPWDIPAMRRNFYVFTLLFLVAVLGGNLRDRSPSESELLRAAEIRTGIQHLVEQGAVIRELY